MRRSAEPFEEALNTIESLAEQDRFSGTVLIRHGDDVLVDKACGLATRRWKVPVRTTTRFDTASITKLFTAAAVLQQADAGRLSLQESIHTYVDLADTAIAADVTIHHLLSHTSGIADDADEEAGESYEALWAERPNYSVTETKDFLPQFAHRTPVFEPGTGCRYNNVGYVLLGLAVEKVTGRSYRDVVCEDIFTRAAMTASGFFDMRQAEPDVAEGWDPVENSKGQLIGWLQNIYSYPPIGSPDGGAHSTGADLIRFLDAVDGGTLLSEASTAQFLSPQALHHTMSQPDSPTATHQLHYGYGLEIEHDAAGGIRSFYKDGINAGSSGIVRRYPRLDLSLAVLSNSEDGAWEPIDLLDQAVGTCL